MLLMAIELMLLGEHNFIAFSRYLSDTGGSDLRVLHPDRCRR